MSTTTTQPLILKVSHLIKASRERIFAAWTSPKEIVKWMTPDPTQCLSAAIDLRVGGKYLIQLKSDNSEETKVHGIYKEINPPSRLVFTWTGMNCLPAMEGMNTEVTVDLIEQAGGTLVQITHVGFPDEEVRDRHVHGWEGSLVNLAKVV
jgi:uncharacterized protein YndB with AHSA1/START domain